MGKNAAGVELAANVATGALAANAAKVPAAAPWFIPQGNGRNDGHFNAHLVNTAFVGTVVLQRSFDGGTTWSTVNNMFSGAAMSFVDAAAAGSFRQYERERSVMYRWNVTAYTSGSLAARLSQ